jgi:hypothetical protein
MIAWGSFVLVLAVSIVAACGLVALFSLGLRLAGPETSKTGIRRILGIVCFVLCGLLVAYGVWWIIPVFHS